MCIRSRQFDFQAFSHNPYLTLDILSRYKDSRWDWKVLAVHPCFPPQKIWASDKDVIMDKWRWPDTFRNPKIDSRMFHLLSRTYRWERGHLLENMFYLDPFAIRTAAYRVQHFITVRYQARKLLAMLRATLRIGRKLPVNVVVSITTFLF